MAYVKRWVRPAVEIGTQVFAIFTTKILLWTAIGSFYTQRLADRGKSCNFYTIHAYFVLVGRSVHDVKSV